MDNNQPLDKPREEGGAVSEAGQVARRVAGTIERNRPWAIAYCTALICAVILAILAHIYAYLPGDLAIAHWVQTINFEPFDTLMWWVTALGLGVLGLAVPVLCACFLLALGRRLEAVFVLLTISAAAVTTMLKDIVLRPRPSAGLVRVLWPGQETGFPSGHALTFTVFYGFLFYLAWTELRPSPLRTVALIILALPIALVGLSRIYLGAHWPSDVLGGYLIGALWLTPIILVYRSIKVPSEA